MLVEVEILKLPQAAERWYLVNSFLELRNRTFIGRKKWSLVVHKDIEFEQKDIAFEEKISNSRKRHRIRGKDTEFD